MESRALKQGENLLVARGQTLKPMDNGIGDKSGASSAIAGFWLMVAGISCCFCGCASPDGRLLAGQRITLPTACPAWSCVTNEIIDSGGLVIPGYSAIDCPEISDEAQILAQVVTADSGAPRTQHPGLDFYVSEKSERYLLRLHFGDRGDGRNSCLPFDECKNMRELPQTYPVSTSRLKVLLRYLQSRRYGVGKFSSWGLPVFPWPAAGSNCGDAFLVTLDRLGLAARVLPDMHQWIRSQHAGVWAFDRGWRRPTDEFFHEPTTRAESGG